MSHARPSRLVVTGSEGTGKTTLSRRLAHQLGARWVAEFARDYAERAAHRLTAADVEPIARGQIAIEDEAEREQPSLLVLDTDLVSTIAYARHYYGTCPPWIVAEASRRLGRLYLLCDIDVPWVPDGVRDRPLERRRVQSCFEETLRELGAPFALVSGSIDERLAQSLELARAAGLVVSG